MARLTYGLRSEGVQPVQPASVIMPKSLQETCGSERNGSSSPLQASISPEAIGGFDVVDDEAHVGQSLRRGQRRRQLAWADEKVIGQSSIPHVHQAALHIGPQQPLRV